MTKETDGNRVIAYISYFAMTKGIIEIENPKSFGMPDYIELDESINGAYRVHKKHAHSTFDEAVKAANKLKANRIKDLRKQIEYLENLRFDIPPSPTS